jgi:hypothetical protein
MEQERLDLQHHLFLLTLDGKLQLAPIEGMKGGIRSMLEIATGTGIWAIDFGIKASISLFVPSLSANFLTRVK